MYRYTYITRLKNSDKFYVGRHESEKHPDKDKYCGSGKWVRGIQEKHLLTREVLEFYETHHELIDAETVLISEHIGTPGCMNFNHSPVGFSTGSLNPSQSPERRLASKNAWSGSNNPSYGGLSDEIKAKLSETFTGRPGRPHTEEAKRKISEKRKEFRYSDESKRKMSESRTGKPAPCSFAGQKHTDATLQRMSESHKNRLRLQCPHCDKITAKNVYVRWHGDNCKKKEVNDISS